MLALNLFHKMKKVGAGEAAATCQPSQILMAGLIVGNELKNN
jgi:hypothetical protein